MKRSWGTFGIISCALALAGCAGGGHVADNQGALTAKLATGSFHLISITSDGYAIVQDRTANQIKAVQLATGVAQVVASGAQAANTDWLTFGPMAIVYTGATDETATMTAWTAAGGAVTLSTSADIVGIGNGLRVSKDGQRIAFWDRIDATTDALVVDNPQHSARQVLTAANAAVHGVIRLPGGTGTRVIASYCTVGGTLAAGNGLVTMWNLPSGVTTTLQTNAQLGVQVNPSGTRAMVRQQGSTATIVTLDGGTRVALDSGFWGGQWFPNGVEFMYVADSALKRICTSGLPETMAEGVAGFAGLSPDSTSVVYYTTASDDGVTTDLRVASTLTRDAPVILNADGAAHAEWYTGDGKQFLFYAAANPNDYVGTLIASPVAGGAGRVLTTTGLSKIDSDLEMSGERVLYNDNWKAATATVPEHVDMKFVDLLSGTIAPVTLVSNVDPYFQVTSDEKLAVYTTGDGLYTVTIP